MLVQICNGSTTTLCYTEAQVLSAIADIMNECETKDKVFVEITIDTYNHI